MKVAELRVGDIIFFVDSFGVPEHVAIYSGMKANTHFIAHATTGTYNSIMLTRLKPEAIPYLVFRPKDFALGAQAAVRMRIWSEHQVPFGKPNINIYNTISDATEQSTPLNVGLAQCDIAKAHFSRNFYRYIEMAAHPAMPYFPHPQAQLQNQGMECAEAIVAAFNVETLLKIEAVKTLDELRTSWISDNTNDATIQKFKAKLPLEHQPSKLYFDYIATSRSAQEYEFMHLPFNEHAPQEIFPPSFFAWNFHKYGTIENFVDHYEFPLRLDAKVTTPWALMTYLENSPHWNSLGKLAIEKKDYPLTKLEADKVQWKKYVEKLFSSADQKQTEIRMRCLTLKEDLSPVKTTHLQSSLKRCRSLSDLESVTTSAAQALEQEATTSQHKKALVFTSPPKPPAGAPIVKLTANQPSKPRRRILNFNI